MLYPLTVTIAATGTAQQLSATRAAATWVQVFSKSTNNALGVGLGNSTVTNPGGATPGVVIAPGGNQMLPQVNSPAPYDLQTIYVNGTVGDVLVLQPSHRPRQDYRMQHTIGQPPYHSIRDYRFRVWKQRHHNHADYL